MWLWILWILFIVIAVFAVLFFMFMFCVGVMAYGFPSRCSVGHGWMWPICMKCEEEYNQNVASGNFTTNMTF